MLLFDVNSFNILLVVSFMVKENSTLLIDKKLNVLNGVDVEYIIPRSRYEK